MPMPLAIALFCSFFGFIVGWLVARPRWNRIKVKGYQPCTCAPHYFVTIIDDEEYWFTQEQLDKAKKMSQRRLAA